MLDITHMHPAPYIPYNIHNSLSNINLVLTAFPPLLWWMLVHRGGWYLTRSTQAHQTKHCSYNNYVLQNFFSDFALNTTFHEIFLKHQTVEITPSLKRLDIYGIIITDFGEIAEIRDKTLTSNLNQQSMVLWYTIDMTSAN